MHIVNTPIMESLLKCMSLLSALAFLGEPYFAVGEFNLTILHTNDVHARFDQMSKYGGHCRPSDAESGHCYGGVARRMTALRHVRNTTENVLFLDAGDQYQGTLWFYIHKGNAAAHFMNLLGYDAMALGNHEFDNHIEGLLPFLDTVQFPILACNIDATAEPEIADTFKPSQVFEFGNTRVGVIGFLTAETDELSNSGHLVFLDVIDSIQKEVTSLKSTGVNIFIALGHSGYPEDIAIAEQVADLDIVIGGHTNTFLYSGPGPSIEVPEGPYPTVITQPSGHQTLVIQDYAFGKYLGDLDVSFDRQGELVSWRGNPWLLDDTVEQAADILEEMIPWRSGVDEINTKVVGKAEVFIDGDRVSCRLRECTMGNLIADAMLYRHQADKDGVRSAEAAILHGGSIRSSLQAGDITLGELKDIQPFSNTVDVIEIQGRHLRDVIEHAVSGYDVSYRKGKFLQFSGMRVLYDISKPDGGKVINICIRQLGHVTSFQPMDDDTVYRIVMPSYIIGGGDGYSMVKRYVLKHDLYESLDVDVTLQYITENSPVHPVLDGRISFVTGNNAANSWLCDRDGANSAQSYNNICPYVFLYFTSLLSFISYH